VSEKILIITDNLRNQVNGVVTTFNSIEPYAKRDGYEMIHITPSHFSYCDCPGYPEVKLALPLDIGKRIEEINPHYIHIATEGPIGFAARCWLDRKHYKYNTSYHTKFPEFLKQIYGIPESLTYRYVRWFHKHSGKVLTTTDTMVKELEQHNFKSNVVAWTRGVDRNYLKPSFEKIHNHYNNLSTPVVLYVGRISREKNLDKLCELKDTYNIKIVGDGPDRQRLEKLYPQVRFLGYLRGTELANLYTLADVFAFPSTTDTFGIVMIEAMSLGTPVAAYPVPGPQDIITQGVSGYMSENLALAIEQCLRLDRNEVKKCSEQWTWENCWQIFKQNLISAT
jgi:glycosyltransferase involved in cell wall biosynthesis